MKKKTQRQYLFAGGALLLLLYWNRQKSAATPPATAYIPRSPVKPAADQPINAGAPAMAGAWEINCYHQVI